MIRNCPDCTGLRKSPGIVHIGTTCPAGSNLTCCGCCAPAPSRRRPRATCNNAILSSSAMQPYERPLSRPFRTCRGSKTRRHFWCSSRNGERLPMMSQAARQAIPERSSRSVLQCGGRCGNRAGDIHARGGGGRAWLLSDQRDPRSSSDRKRLAAPAGPSHSGRGALCRLAGASRRDHASPVAAAPR